MHFHTIDLRRWVYFVLIAAVCVIVGWFLLHLRGFVVRYFNQVFADLHSWAQTAGAILVTTLFFAVVLKLSPFRRGQFRSLLFYPPTWLAFFTALAVLCAVDLLGMIGPRGHDGEAREWFGIVAAALVLLWVVHWVSVRPSKPNKRVGQVGAVTAATSLPHNWDTLGEWLRSETPADGDLLNRRPLARRIVELLRAPLGMDKTIGLIGPFGSGKTTVVEWVREEVDQLLKDCWPSVWICPVSCWGFEDSSAAIQHILVNLVKTISEHADCFSVRNLPESYRKTLSVGGGWLPSVAEALLGQHDPTEQLRRLTPILDAMRARLVIVVEDLDRKQSTKFDPQDVLALLHRLRSVRGVSFILTSGSLLQSKIDFTKLCDHIEMIPPMNDDAVLALIRNLREHCLEEYADLNPAALYGRGTRKTELWDGPSSREGLYFSLGIDWMAPSAAVLSLISTPRTLKHALRHTATAWEKLHGEIDFDELLIANVLRWGAPEAFDFLLDKVDLLRCAPSPANNDDKKQLSANRCRAMRSDWETATKSVQWNSRAALELIVFLVPTAATYLKDREPYDQGSPQGIRHVEPTDYWRRLLSGELAAGEVSDQEVLQAIEKWSSNPTPEKPLVHRLYAEQQFASVWGHFSDTVPDAQVLELAGQVFGLLLELEGVRASLDHHGALALSQRASRQSHRDDSSERWLESMLRSSIGRSLHFCVDLYFRWASIQSGIVSTEERKTVREAMVEAAQYTFKESDPHLLLDALDEKYPYAIRQLVFPNDHDDPESILRKSADWQWFAPVLLAAAMADPRKILPQLAYLVSESGARPRSVPQLMEQRVTEIFGERANELLSLLSQDVPTGLETDDLEYLRIIRQQAVQWLQRRSSPCPSRDT